MDRTDRSFRVSIGGVALAVATLLTTAGCSSDSPTSPSGDHVATISVIDELFRVRLVGDAQLRAAAAARAGGSARIPVGRIVAGTDVNTGYSWHLEDVSFAEVAIEVCDGLPSHVERAGGPAFGTGTYCPWSAQVRSIEPLR